VLRPDHGVAANRQPASRLDGSDNLSAILATDGVFPVEEDVDAGCWFRYLLKNREIKGGRKRVEGKWNLGEVRKGEH
jgi:hypothetical protein